MATLLITKETGGYFSFVVDGNTADKITNMRNDALAVGTKVHFKTANGANIVKTQNIDVTAITLVASGSFTFATVNLFFAKLIDVGYWDWLLGGGGGTGTDRFDELLDTFDYFGNDMKAVRVNESQLKLEPFTVYNYRKIVDLEDTFSAIVPNKMLATSADGLSVELRDLPETPETYLNAVGSFNYNDLATHTSPITVTASVEAKLTNDTEGLYTDITLAPFGVSSTWNPATNQFDFSQLSVGDWVDLRTDILIDLVGTNTSYKLYLKMAVGSGAEWTLNIHNGERKTTTEFNEVHYLGFVIGNIETKDYPAELWILTDANATIKVNGWLAKIVRKNINVGDFNLTQGDISEINHAAFEKTSLVDADELSGMDSDSDYSLIRIQMLNIWNYIKDKTATLFQYKLVAGTNISIDNTNPLAPIISASGAGSSETTTTMGALINSATAATPNDTDLVATAESAGLLKKITWTNAKAFLKTYFDTLYTTTGAVATQITTALSGYLTSSGAAAIYETIANVALKSNIASPTFTGTPAAPTAAVATNTTQIATTAFVQEAMILPVTETGTSFSLANANNGKITILTASCTVTIPNGLIAGFEHTIVTLAGVTLTVALGGSVVLFNNTGLTMAEKLSCTIKNRTTTNNYITAGSL